MDEEITITNFKDLDMRSLALNKDRFGEITFDRSLPNLEKLQGFFKEFDELQYEKNLLPESSSQINNQRERFIELLKRLQGFRLSEGFNKDIRDQFENEVDSLYQDTFRTDLHWLTYLRQNAALEGKDTKKLLEAQKAVSKLKSEYETVIEQLRQEKTAIDKEKSEVERAYGERAAVTFGKHFEKSAVDYANRAKNWRATRDLLYKWFLGIAIANFAVFLILFVTNKFGFWPRTAPEEFFTVPYAVVKIALLGLLSYAIGFSSKNYGINSNLEAINTHKKNVAETLNDFLKSSPDSEDRAQIVRIGAESMFHHPSTGYTIKDGNRDDGPVREIITNVISGKNV